MTTPRRTAVLSALIASVIAVNLVPIAPVRAQRQPPDRRFGAIESFRDPVSAAEVGVGWERILLYWSQLQPNGPDDWNGSAWPTRQDIEGQVARGIHHKLVRRHPHIFGETVADTAEQVKVNWDQIKRHTEGREGIFHHIPASFPALLLAQKLQARAAEVGFDWPDAYGPLEKVREEQRELEEELQARSSSLRTEGHPAQPPLRVAEEMGDVLFALVNLARKLKVDPELALRAASLRFRERVSGAEILAAEAGEEFAGLGLERQEEYYQQAKQRLQERDGR